MRVKRSDPQPPNQTGSYHIITITTYCSHFSRGMSASVQFTPLCGEHAPESCLYLLQVDECKILLDCGWDFTAHQQPTEALAQLAPDIDCVLLSHADLEHIGFVPIAVAKLGLGCPIYATLPVCRIGKLVLYEAIASANKRFAL